MMHFLENVLAAVGLIALAAFAAYGVLSLEKRTEPQIVQTPMHHPMLCDATVSQGTYGQMSKPRCYMKGNK